MDRIAEFRVLLVVAKSRSFSAAARAVHLTPSAISKTVTRVEAYLKIRIFDRTSKYVALTGDGKNYIQSVEKIVEAVDECDMVTQRLSRELRGKLRVHVPPVFAANYIAPLLPEFARHYPDVNIEFNLGSQVNGPTGDTDVVIQFGPLPDSEFIAKRIASSRRIICASPDYIREHGAPKSLEDLACHRLMTHSVTEGSRWPFLVKSKIEHVRINPAATANQAEFLLRSTLQGGGLARFAEYIVYDHLRAGRLVAVLNDLAIKDGIFVLTRKSKNLSPRLRVFISSITQHLKTQPWNLDRKT
jgi:DNA-binding transcriptional LysR family regulator